MAKQKKLTTAQMYPNRYKIMYENHKGEPRTKVVRGLTADEAKVRFLTKAPLSVKNVKVRRLYKGEK